MEKNVYQVESPWFKTVKNIVIGHVNNVHQGAVIVWSRHLFNMGGFMTKNLGNISNVCYPRILKYLPGIVEHKIVK